MVGLPEDTKAGPREGVVGPEGKAQRAWPWPQSAPAFSPLTTVSSQTLSQVALFGIWLLHTCVSLPTEDT